MAVHKYRIGRVEDPLSAKRIFNWVTGDKERLNYPFESQTSLKPPSLIRNCRV
jgi:hypothetical protein